MCYNKDSVGALCPLQHAYFGVVTETGGLSERRKGEKELPEEDTKGVFKPRVITDSKKTKLVPWCRLEAPVKVTLCLLVLYVVLRVVYHLLANFFTALRTFSHCLLEFIDDSSYLQDISELYNVV